MNTVITQRDVNKVLASPSAVYSIFGTLALFGLILSGIAIKAFMHSDMSQYWISVDGRVISSGVSSRESTYDTPSYDALIVYEYNFAGTRYEGNKISHIGWSASDLRTAKSISDRYAPGTAVRVYVNPVAPYEALLRIGAGLDLFMCIIFGFLFGVIGVVGLVSAPKMIKDAQAWEKELLDQMAGKKDPLSKG